MASTPHAKQPEPAKSHDLAGFDLSDMIECGRRVREVSDAATNMEAAAREIVQYLYAHLGSAGARDCALVRCFKTHRLGQLPVELAEAARGVLLDPAQERPDLPCLTLLATAGDLPEWNDRRGSRGHAAIPLESLEMLSRAPMIAALLRQMGIDIQTALDPDARLLLDADQHAFNVFHVEHAPGSPLIPAQDFFVKPHGIQSVLGFGGLLPTGELFAIIMFARTTIPRQTADMFRTIALGVKLALLPFAHGPFFDAAPGEPPTKRPLPERLPGEPLGEPAEELLRSEIGTLRLLIPALEGAALHQTHRLKTAFADLQAQGDQVRQQDARLSAMLESTTDAIFLLDSEWRFTFLNGHAEALIANGRNLLGSSVWDLFPDAVGTAFWTQYHRVMQEGATAQFEEYYPAPLDKWFEVRAFPSEQGLAAFFHDITDRRKTEAALRQTEKLAVTGRLAASIAHEINNPLAAVTNLLYLLELDPSLDCQATARVQEAQHELQRISEITTHMLRFYRQSSRPADVAVHEVLDSVLVLFKGKFAHSSVAIEKRYRPARCLRGLPGELRQVFANLVGNALDASREGGRLALRVREMHDPVTGLEGVRITIADTGSGMSTAVVAQIFEPFFTTKGMTGTGLGLWVSKELVEKHRGRIAVRSSEHEDHHGTVFAVFFPFLSQAEADGVAAAEALPAV